MTPEIKPILASSKLIARHSKKCILLGLILLLQVASTAARRTTYNFRPADKTISELKWILDATVNGVDFYHSIAECNGKNSVFLKLVNGNNYPVKVSWKEVFATQEGPQVEGYLGLKSIELNPGELSETNCNNPTHPQLLILSQQVKPTYAANITNFNYKALNVSKMN